MKRDTVSRTVPPELNRIRGRIDEIDADLVDLMAARVALTREAMAE